MFFGRVFLEGHGDRRGVVGWLVALRVCVGEEEYELGVRVLGAGEMCFGSAIISRNCWEGSVIWKVMTCE
jgi:hypothetical protein